MPTTSRSSKGSAPTIQLATLNGDGPHGKDGHADRNGAANPPAVQSVNQENQDNQEFLRVPPKLSENPRGDGGSVAEREYEEELPSPQLPLGEYLAKAVDLHNAVLDLRTWSTPLFKFIRVLKAHPEMAALTAKQAIQVVEDSMARWRKSLKKDPKHPPDNWEVYFGVGVTREDAHAEFIGAWDKVRYLPGYDPLANAVEQARRAPLEPKDEVLARRTEGYPKFVSIAGWLQVAMGNRPILLPVEALAEVLDVEPMTVSRYRKWAIEDGYLKEVKPYTFRGKGKGKATEFVFDVALFNCLREPAEEGTAEAFRGAAQ